MESKQPLHKVQGTNKPTANPAMELSSHYSIADYMNNLPEPGTLNAYFQTLDEETAKRIERSPRKIGFGF